MRRSEVCECACVRESWRRPREALTIATMRHCDWHHIWTERGGTKRQRNKNLESRKCNEGLAEIEWRRERETKRKGERDKGGRGGNP